MNTGGEMKRIEQCGRNEMAETNFENEIGE